MKMAKIKTWPLIANYNGYADTQVDLYRKMVQDPSTPDSTLEGLVAGDNFQLVTLARLELAKRNLEKENK